VFFLCSIELVQSWEERKNEVDWFIGWCPNLRKKENQKHLSVWRCQSMADSQKWDDYDEQHDRQ